MWVTRTIGRARYRFRRPAPPPPASIAVAVDGLSDVAVSLGRPELERLVAALSAALGPSMQRPDSPALLAGALETAIRRSGGCGRVTVTRSPAGLYTPEYWHIRVEGADAASRAALDGLTATDRGR